MFPVPSHLPRNGGDHLASPPGELETAGKAGSAAGMSSVLSLFEPLLRGQELDSKTVKGVRESLQAAIISNKTTSHELLKANYPSISSHIRAGSQITSDFASIQKGLNELESKLDPDNAETSFIPPVIALLRRHFNAVQAQTHAEARVKALKQLKVRTEALKQLEDGVNGARGADDTILALLDGKDETLAEALAQSEVIKSIKSRTDALRATVTQQVLDGYQQAILVEQGSKGQNSIKVQEGTKLQRPRNTRSGQSTSSAEEPSYQLEQIYTALARLEALSEPLRQLQSRILKDIIGPLLGGTFAISENTNGNVSTLRLEAAPDRTPSDMLSDLFMVYTFVTSKVFPVVPAASRDRDIFLNELHSSISDLLLSQLITPSIPSSRADLPTWLDTVRSAVEFETSTSPTGSSADALSTFLENQAGPSWANQRRKQVGEQVRRSIVDGWQGWQAVEISRDKEISVVVEVEVEEEEKVEDVIMSEPVPDAKAPTVPAPSAPSTTASVAGEEEEGWDFEEPQLDSQPEAGPSSPRKSLHDTADADDGWAFDDDLSAPTPAPAPAPIKPAKPAREAKKLGKKVAKSKVVQDEHESGNESMPGTDMSRSSSIQSPLPPRAPSPEVKSGGMDWAAWDDEPVKKEESKPKAKRKVLKEEKRTIKETFLVSAACDSLLELVEQVLRDAQEISLSPPATSFALAPALLYTTTTEVFDLYRSLIRSHFAEQLRSVPTLSMQVYNDSIHLSDRVAQLARQYDSSSSSEVQRKLREFGEGCFERELYRQRESLVNTLDTIEWNGGVEGFKRGARIPGQVKSDLEDLSRMFHTVLPKTIYLSVMGYLVNVVITYVTDAILSQQDITEEESNHLNELLRTLHPLEELFVLESGQPSTVVEHVHGWLKFCYLSELLSANLVDITYLFENGALIDFTPDELISLLKALFADSEKREKAIERIERGL